MHIWQPLFSRTFTEIYKHKTRLCIHISRQRAPPENPSLTLSFPHTIGRPFETLLDCAALVYGGIPEKFPKLRVAFLECGCGWAFYWMDRMDEEWEKRASEAPLLKKKPSEYMTSGNWFYATEPEESTLLYVMEKI